MADHTALLLAAVPLLLTLFGVVWKMSALASTLTETIKAHKDDLNELREKLSLLDAIPVIEVDMEQQKHMLAKLSSEFPKLDKRLLRVEWKLNLTPSGTRPPSIHDIQAYLLEQGEEKKKP